MYTKEDLIYIAGFFDGEGCVTSDRPAEFYKLIFDMLKKINRRGKI